MTEGENEILKFMEKRFEANDKKFENLLELNREEIKTSREEIRELVGAISHEHQKTRGMIRRRYDAFGDLTIILLGLIVGVYAIMVMEPINIDNGYKSFIAVVLSIGASIFSYTKYSSRRKDGDPDIEDSS